MNDGLFILRDLDKFTSVTDAIIAKELNLKNIVLKCGVIESNYYLSQKLNVSLATKLFYLSRLRVVNGKPRSIEKTYIEYDKVKGLEKEDFTDVSFYRVLDNKTGFKINMTNEEILIVEANEEECEHLELEMGDEVVLIKGTAYIEDGNPFEYFEVTSIPSFYRFRSV